MYFPVDDILNNTSFGIPNWDSSELTDIILNIYDTNKNSG